MAVETCPVCAAQQRREPEKTLGDIILETGVVPVVDECGQPVGNLAATHLDHYKSCWCLGDSATCCVPGCACKEDEELACL